MLYTLEWSPCYRYLGLFVHTLVKLPSIQRTICRGVRGNLIVIYILEVVTSQVERYGAVYGLYSHDNNVLYDPNITVYGATGGKPYTVTNGSYNIPNTDCMVRAGW